MFGKKNEVYENLKKLPSNYIEGAIWEQLLND
jgi:hypothetical protein